MIEAVGAMALDPIDAHRPALVEEAAKSGRCLLAMLQCLDALELQVKLERLGSPSIIIPATEASFLPELFDMCCGRSAAIRFLRLGTDVDSTLSRFPAAYCPSSFTSFLEACTRADAVAEVLPRQSAVALPRPTSSPPGGV